MSGWTLHFQSTLQMKNGTTSLDLYTLRQANPAAPFITVGVPHKNLDLPNMLERALNGVPQSVEMKEYTITLRKIFYGPWEKDGLTGIQFVRVSEQEERQIKRMIFKENAERVMAENNLRVLRADYEKLQKYCAAQEQEVLRLKARPPSLAEHGLMHDTVDILSSTAIEPQEFVRMLDLRPTENPGPNNPCGG